MPQTFDEAVARALDGSERAMRSALRKIGDGVFHATDYLEDRRGEPSIAIALRLELRDGGALLDYTGTSPQCSVPLNAVFGVTLSGVHYALRAVTDPTIPMNEGCFRPVEVRVPDGTLLNPRRPAPVSGGNVETSMRNAEVVLQALACAAPERVPACSGGTMSNVMLGGTRPDGRTWAFYETNGCGVGRASERRWRRRHPMPHDQHAQHADRSGRTRVSVAHHALRNRGRHRRCRAAPRRQRSDPRDRAHRRRRAEQRCSPIVTHCAHRVHTAGNPGACGRHILKHDGTKTLIGAKTSLPLEPGRRADHSNPGRRRLWRANCVSVNPWQDRRSVREWQQGN